MNTLEARNDPAFAAMTLDLVANVLSRAESPDRLAPFLTEELRELSGARCVLLYGFPADPAAPLRLLGLNPPRLVSWAESPDRKRLLQMIRGVLEAPAAAGKKLGTCELLAEQGFGLSAIIPLRIGELPVGAIVLLGLPTEQHLSAEFDFLNTLAPVVGLVLRNAMLFERQEQVILERTRDLREANEVLRLTQFSVDAARDAIIWFVPQGQFHYANDAACDLLDCPRAELLGKSAWDFNPAHPPARWLDHWNDLKRNHSVVVEAKLNTPTGRVVEVEITANYVSFGGREYNCSFLRDISRRRLAEVEARRRLDLAERSRRGLLSALEDARITEQRLQRSQAELEAIYDSNPIMMCLVNRQLGVERMNRAMHEYMDASDTWESGQGPGDVLGCIAALDNPKGCGSGSSCRSCSLRLMLRDTFATGEARRQVEAGLYVRRGDSRREVQLSVSTALLRIEREPKVVLCLEDITARKHLQAQLLQAQKMEAVGQLAGGVAHDFNNILAAMLMNIELVQRGHSVDQNLRASLKELEEGAQRAAGLTRQLLLFSRRQTIQVRRLDLNGVVEGLMKMLRRLLGEHILMAFNRSEAAQWVEADAGMIEQVIMNLCVNARDAMPRGGRLTLRTQTVDVGPEAAARHESARVGSFICLTVADTGVGMDGDTQRRIFEPFFTTKEAGQGTGLGLATVYGIVSQHRGWVEVESAPDCGTTFRVFLPASVATTAEAASTESVPRGGAETILVVEDDTTVRRTVVRALRQYGYEVLEAANGVEALRLWQTCGNRVSLLLTDMVMPEGMTGLELVQELQRLRPGLKALITSGYSIDLLQRAPDANSTFQFLSKPYAPLTLARAVRACLDVPAS